MRDERRPLVRLSALSSGEGVDLNHRAACAGTVSMISAVTGSRASGLLGDGCRRAYGRRHVDEGGGQEQGGEGDAEQGEAAERER